MVLKPSPSQIGLNKAVDGDIEGASEQARRCLEVMRRFPGLCRSSTG